MTVQEPGPTILYTSWDVHKGIKKLFSDGSGRRVVLVAYVGVDALAFLPSPSGVRVVCSPQPIGTSHAAIGELLDRGAQVQFSDALHMKVFWSEKKGCIIGSANLSNHALGAGGLKRACCCRRAT